MARELYPSFLDLVGRRVLVVGAGPVAAGKAARLLDAGAHVVVVAPRISADVERLPVDIIRREFQPADLDECWYVVSAAPPEVNRQVAREAQRRRVFVNAVDDPAHATAYAGSGFRRGPVTVAISTGGESPALARVLREALERLVGRDVETWNALATNMRDDWRRDHVPIWQRRDALLTALAQLHEEAEAARFARTAERRTQNGAAKAAPLREISTTERGLVSLVGAGPGNPELLTRLAARRLAEADLVLYDALVSPATVALATRAQRVFVGRRAGSETLGQAAIIRTMIRAARRGRRVVRLKGGDPFVFGRGGEEALALAEAGVSFEIVPGVSSALAAPALASIPVTHRGVSGAVLVTTGHDAERFAETVRGVKSVDTTVVVLMGTANRPVIAPALIGAGWSPATPAAIVSNASHRDAEVWTGRLDALGDAPLPPDAPGTIVVGKVVALRELLRTVPAKGHASAAAALGTPAAGIVSATEHLRARASARAIARPTHG